MLSYILDRCQGARGRENRWFPTHTVTLVPELDIFSHGADTVGCVPCGGSGGIWGSPEFIDGGTIRTRRDWTDGASPHPSGGSRTCLSTNITHYTLRGLAKPGLCLTRWFYTMTMSRGSLRVMISPSMMP